MNSDKLKISLIICTYNRDKFIGDALNNLTFQTLPKNLFQIIIINNNCTDTTDTVCKQFITENPQLQIKYIIETQQGLSFARNRGIKEADFEIITYIDDDAFAKPEFLEIIYNYFNEYPNISGVGGKVIPRYETSEPDWMNKYLHGFVTKVDHGDRIKKFSNNQYPAGCNMTYRKTILEKVGGFNTKLKWRADDKYIYFKIKDLSDDVFYLPEAIVEHVIDAQRISDENFYKLSRKVGSEEGIRIRDEGLISFFIKLIEYLIKFFGSVILAIPFFLKGQIPKGKYIIVYRYLALQGFLYPNK